MPRIINLPTFIDRRGNLTVYDTHEDYIKGFAPYLPFEPRRIFWIWEVPKGQERANHAHKICEQVIIPLVGAFVTEIDDDNRYYLRIHTGLYVEAGHKIRLYSFSEGAVCLVLCSEHYDTEEVMSKTEL